MVRKLLLLLIYMLLFMQIVFASESLKINSINFDNSDSIIFLGTSTTSETAVQNITKKTLTNPDRVFFDIENAVITFPNSIFELKNSRLKQVRIAQNSISPDIVRIVILNSEGYDTNQIKILNIKNNIIVKLGSEKPLQQYLTQVYKETKESNIEYYDKVLVFAEGKNTVESDEIFNSVQRAFSEDGQELVRPNIEQKQAKLTSRFFLDNVSPRDGAVLLSGIGVVNVEKPFVLTNPSRIVFDLPNTVVLPELREKEFKISAKESVKIGQFEPSKARIVIKSLNPESFKPVYSTNLQTLFFTNKKILDGVSVTPVKTELVSLKSHDISPLINQVNIIFSNPVIYSIKKKLKEFQITFYNLTNFDYVTFNADMKKNKSGFNMKKKDINTYVLSIPVKNNDFVDCYETLNASQLLISITKESNSLQLSDDLQKEQQVIPSQKTLDITSLLEHQNKKSKKKFKKTYKAILEKLNKKIIILDPGHGGNDTGAMRSGILEKDLTLSIALKVRECLREMGLTNIIMTRSTDKTLTLDERVQISNVNDADIFVSIHINASVKSEIKGLETHYYTDKGYNLAQLMHTELTSKINAADRGLFKSKFYVIKNTEAPAVLLELGFISNENERKELTSESRQLDSARAIADGIVSFLMEHLNE